MRLLSVALVALALVFAVLTLLTLREGFYMSAASNGGMFVLSALMAWVHWRTR